MAVTWLTVLWQKVNRAVARHEVPSENREEGEDSGDIQRHEDVKHRHEAKGEGHSTECKMSLRKYPQIQKMLRRDQAGARRLRPHLLSGVTKTERIDGHRAPRSGIGRILLGSAGPYSGGQWPEARHL